MDDELLADLEAVEDERQEPLPSEQIDEVLAGEEGELSQQSPVAEVNPEERTSSVTDLGKRRPEQTNANDLPKRPRPSSPPPTSHHVPRPVPFTPLTPPHQLRAPLPHTLLPEHRKALTSPPPTSIMGHYHNPYAKAAAAASPGGILPAPSAQPSGILPAPHVPLPPPVLATGMYHHALPPPQLVKQAPRPAPQATPPMWSQEMRQLNTVRPGDKAQLTLKFGNVSADTPLAELEALFRTIGPIRSINLNKPTREGTVTFHDANTALIAKRRLHRHFLRGHNITVEFV